MEETMVLVEGIEGKKWDYFRDITQKWIKCLSGSSSYINEFNEDANNQYINFIYKTK